MNFYAKYLAIKRYWPTPKLLLVMKLTVLWMFLALSQVYANSYAQKISLNERNMPLAKVLGSIEKQSGYVFLYDDKEVGKIKVSVQIQAASIQQALDASLKDQSLTYRIVDKTVMIRKEKSSVVDRIIEFFTAIDVNGKVVDERGEPLPGATVKVKGTGIATVTNEDGEFFLKGVPEDAVILIAYIGYKPLEVKASPSLGTIRMDLAPSELDEVTVSTGYWTTTKALSTGNISKVTAKEIENQPVVSPLLALQGRVPGLEINMPANSTPGVAPKIRIRGVNSLRTTDKTYRGLSGLGSMAYANDPLYIIDGVPVSSNSINNRTAGLGVGGFDPLSSINPENIASIEVLKDADATAIYGSRGSNGVILITTKSATENGERTRVEASIYSGFGKIAEKIDLLNTEQYLMMLREANANDGLQPGIHNYELLYWDQNRNTDWQDELTGGTANIADVQLTISGSSKQTTYRLNGAFHKETSIYPGDFAYSRPALQVNLQHTSKNQRFKVGYTSNFGYSKNKLAESGELVGSRLILPPNAPRLYNDDGTLNWEIHEIGGKMTSTWSNPLAYLYNTQNSSENYQVSNFTFSYELFPNLSLQANAGYNNLTNSIISGGSVSHLPPDRGGNGISGNTQISTKRFSWIVEPQLTYSKKLNEHSLNLVFGSSWQMNTDEYKAIRAQYNSEIFLNSLNGATTITPLVDNTFEYKYVSAYGRIGYNWRQKYLINLTGRRDGSSRFGPNNRFGNFGAIGAAWLISEEDWFKRSLPALTFAKIRGSYGITGSDAVTDYSFYDLYDVSGRSYDGVPGIRPTALFNPDFFWESTYKLETAIELNFWNNRLGTEISWYRNRTSDQLVDFTLPEMTGFPSVLSNFGAVVQNTGLEGVLHGIVTNSKRLKWDASFNITFPKNKLLRFDGIEDAPFYNTSFKVGEPLSIQWLYKYIGVNPQSGLYEFEDVNNDGVLNDLDKLLMNPLERKFYGGLTNNLQFKEFTFSIHFQFSSQPALRYLPQMPGSSFTNQPIEVLDRWFAPGDQTDIQRFGTTNIDGALRPYIRLQQSSYNTEDASFIRLKTLSLGYMLPTRLLTKINLQTAKFFIQGQNIFTLTRYTGLDPETGVGIPPLRMFTAGIQIGL